MLLKMGISLWQFMVLHGKGQEQNILRHILK